MEYNSLNSNKLNYAKRKKVLKHKFPLPFLIRRWFDCSTATRISDNIKISKNIRLNIITRILKYFLPIASKFMHWKYLSKHNALKLHCVKSVRVRSYSCPYFPILGLNRERYCGVSTNYGLTDPTHYSRQIWTETKIIFYYIITKNTVKEACNINREKEIRIFYIVFSFFSFIRKTKNWNLHNCPYRLCKTYMWNFGFI